MCSTSRGIGLQFVKQLSASPKNIVIASCRKPDTASDLKALQISAKGKLHIVELEVTNETSIKAAAAKTSEILGGKGLDYLLNNAAVVSLRTSESDRIEAEPRHSERRTLVMTAHSTSPSTI